MTINTSEIDALFAAAIAKTTTTTTTTPAKPAIVNILDMRKGNNIAIGLSQIKGVTPNQIAQAILQAKDGILTTEHLEMLAKYIPTSEEMENIKAYTGDKALLGLAERYYLEIDPQLIPRFEQKIKALILKDQFSARIGKLLSDLTILKTAAVQLTESTNLLKLLEGILAIGNYLNAGSKIAQAYGFKLDALRKVADTRATGRKINLLHYVIESIERVDKSVLFFAGEIKEASKAASLPLQNMASDLAALTNEVKSIAKEIESTDPQSAAFREVFKNFSVTAQMEVDSAARVMKDMEDAVRKMFVFYGDDPKKTEDPKAIEDFLKLIVGFSNQFESAVRDLAKEREAAAKAAAKAAAQAKAGAKAPAKKAAASTGGSGGVLDNLFDSIKAGNFKAKHVETKEAKNLFAKEQSFNVAKPGAKPEDGKSGDAKPGDAKPGDGDAKPGDAKPGDAKPGDTKPGDAKPGDGKPVDTKPGDTKPGDAKLEDVQVGATKPGDADPKPVNAKPGDTKPEVKPGDTKPGDAKPEGAKPGDAKPGDAKPGDAKPGDAKPIDTKPEDVKLGDPKPVDAKPEDTKAGDAKPEDVKPNDVKLEDAKPNDTKPGEASRPPEDSKTSDSKSTDVKLEDAKPEDSKPDNHKPGDDTKSSDAKSEVSKSPDTKTGNTKFEDLKPDTKLDDATQSSTKPNGASPTDVTSNDVSKSSTVPQDAIPIKN
eukprot:Phypoly_transcript_03230.p1 GENE.Phypoly_transcript_03230~~Phypoly_transcript_03230.p1  ORF type:complete len:808 (+),score=212.09 Phypoly_transcript_03230:295-2424(+)